MSSDPSAPPTRPLTGTTPLTRENWPIAGAMLQFPGVHPDGSRAQDDPGEAWAAAFAELADVGFDRVEVNDNWVRVGDLSGERVDELAEAGRSAGTMLGSVAIVRSSVTEPDRERAEANLAYSHRTLENVARLGGGIVSIGFHRALTAAQQQALWFWLEPGERDDPDDAEHFALVVRRVQELGRHAADLGLQLTLEMYEDTYLGTAESAVRMVTEVGLPNVGLNPDVGNLIRLHRPIVDWAATYAAVLPHANYWHIKNYFRDEDPGTGAVFATPAPLELGLVDYRRTVRQAVALGFRGTFVCEHYGGDGLGVSALNRDYLRRVLPATVDDPGGDDSTVGQSAAGGR